MKYELLYILHNKFTDDQKSEIISRVDSLISGMGATIEKTDNLGVKRFAYEIEKSREGTYVLVTFDAPTNVPAMITARLNIDETVLRSMITTK